MSARCALALDRVRRHFGGVAAVKDVTLKVALGERRVILGPNGAGKTTLFALISGDLRVDGGSIAFDGRDVTRRPTRQRVRSGLRRTYQTSLAFAGLTVRECLFLAVRGVSGGRFAVLRPAAASREMDESDRLATHAGLGSLLHVRTSELSHGALRQVEVAMTLAGHPRLILLDEPAAGLSSPERADLLAMLRTIPRDVTLLIIEHDVEFALAVADRVAFMESGALIADGAPAEIASNRRIHEAYIRADVH